MKIYETKIPVKEISIDFNPRQDRNEVDVLVKYCGGGDDFFNDRVECYSFGNGQYLQTRTFGDKSETPQQKPMSDELARLVNESLEKQGLRDRFIERAGRLERSD